MANLLDSTTFGDFLYNKFPSVYRQADQENKLFLKRYFDALTEGGFSSVIEEVNGLTNLIDPRESDEEFLPTLYESYGVTVFNGLPIKFLRGLFPYLNSLFARKGSDSVISYMSSIILGANVKVEKDLDFKHNYLLHLYVDVDSRVEDDFPNTDQLERILEFFLPFFCRLALSYASFDTDIIEVSFFDIYSWDHIYETTHSHTNFVVVNGEYIHYKGVLNDPMCLLNDSFYLSSTNDGNDINLNIEEIHEDEFIESLNETTSLTGGEKEENTGVLNSRMCTLGGNFYLSSFSGYDIIKSGDEQTTVFY